MLEAVAIVVDLFSRHGWWLHSAFRPSGVRQFCSTGWSQSLARSSVSSDK